jgi:hypothetical protein
MHRMLPLLALASTAAGLAAPAAHAQSTATIQYAGDPFTYLVQGKPATALNVVFQVTAPLPSGATLTVQTAGGTALGNATPRSIGTTGLCYRAAVVLSSPVSNGGNVEVVLAAGGQQLQPNPELVRQISARKANNPTTLVAGADC